jgi:hypothetical protein
MRATSSATCLGVTSLIASNCNEAAYAP